MTMKKWVYTYLSHLNGKSTPPPQDFRIYKEGWWSAMRPFGSTNYQ